MKTAIAISPMTRNVLSEAKIPPAAVTASQTARIAPRTVPMIRPMCLVCTRRLWQAAVAPTAPRRSLVGRLTCLTGTAPGSGRSQPGCRQAHDDRRAVRAGKDVLAGTITAPTIALRRIAPTADAARRDARAWPDRSADAAGAWRRDGFAVLPGCLDGPGLEAAWRNLADFVCT